MSDAIPAALVRALFDAPLLRGLGARDRDAILRTARTVRLAAGDGVYAEAAPADSVFVVVTGAVGLLGARRGDRAPSLIRLARVGESFGEEALLSSAGRRLAAVAETDAEVVEIAAAVLERALGRSGGSEVASRELRFAQRLAMSDLLRTTAFARDLPETDFEILLDAARPKTVARGERVFSAGDPAASFFLIVEGLIQLQSSTDDRIEVRAYLDRGDFFGDEDLFRNEPRSLTAVASGGSQLVEVPAEALRTLADRNPKLLGRVRRVQADRGREQERALGATGPQTTQHVFRDAYRMQMARSLLVIDQDTCVRCGHCAWTCESLYGVSRLVRRGDKIVTSEHAGPSGGSEKSLLLPNSCQHCKNPLCMVDCPTGAIGRDPLGEVFIREELCIGCGNCAKACPWDNIRMAPRPAGAIVAESLRLASRAGEREVTAAQLFPEVAVKCDLCRGYEAPACVSACPTQSIFRLEPTQDIAEVAALFGSPPESPPSEDAAAARQAAPVARATRVTLGLTAAFGLALGLGGAAALAHARGALDPAGGLGLAAGWISLAAVVTLVLYAVPKRFARLWLRRREARGRRASIPSAGQRRNISRVRPFYRAHLVVGAFGLAAVLVHAGPVLSSVGASGALGLVFFLVSLLGVLGAVLYRVVPRRLSRLERRGTLPEDVRQERERLFDRMHREASGKSDLVKALLDNVLVPYARSSVGSAALLLSGRSRREEEARLLAQVEAMLEGRGGGKLEGLSALVRVVVELRTLPVRRFLSFALRGWLVLHIVLTGALLGLLALHLVRVLS